VFLFSSQHEEKERAFKEQLSHLAALLPTLQVSFSIQLSFQIFLLAFKHVYFYSLQVHLVTCSAFLSSANKFEFLDMGYVSKEK